jgi:CubicO group peptidase (beta-lactamase class C family)
MKRLFLSTAIAVVFSTSVHAGELRLNLVAGNVLHNRNHTDLSALPPANLPRNIPYASSGSSSSLAGKAKVVASNDGNVALMVIENGKIVFENYKQGTNKSSHFLSMSMAKSLTAYTMAEQVCDGRIRNLNDSIGKYAPEIGFTFYNDVTLYNSLRMASGHAKPTEHGHTIPKQFQKLTLTNEIEMMDLFRVAKQSAPQGTKFRYNGHDTASLERVIAANASQPNMVPEFRRNVWSKIGAESNAFWLTDRNGTPLSFSGFYATMPDWARLAIWSLEKVKEQSCVGNYMRQATSVQSKGQIENDAPQGRSFTGYGFQTWLRKGQYWWVGYGGQRVGVDPAKNRIVIAFSTQENYMPDIYRLMDY